MELTNIKIYVTCTPNKIFICSKRIKIVNYSVWNFSKKKKFIVFGIIFKNKIKFDKKYFTDPRNFVCMLIVFLRKS